VTKQEFIAQLRGTTQTERRDVAREVKGPGQTVPLATTHAAGRTTAAPCAL
jgi:hypothetical protein